MFLRITIGHTIEPLCRQGKPVTVQRYKHECALTQNTCSRAHSDPHMHVKKDSADHFGWMSEGRDWLAVKLLQCQSVRGERREPTDCTHHIEKGLCTSSLLLRSVSVTEALSQGHRVTIVDTGAILACNNDRGEVVVVCVCIGATWISLFLSPHCQKWSHQAYEELLPQCFYYSTILNEYNITPTAGSSTG